MSPLNARKGVWEPKKSVRIVGAWKDIQCVLGYKANVPNAKKWVANNPELLADKQVWIEEWKDGKWVKCDAAL